VFNQRRREKRTSGIYLQDEGKKKEFFFSLDIYAEIKS
jgi:hypothetical protein